MLFNSFAFLLAFLPAALGLHAAAERWWPVARLPLLVALLWVLFRAPTFGVAASLYRSLLGFEPLGHDPKVAVLLVPAAVAMLGPTAWNFVHRSSPRPSLAALFAALFVFLLFKIGDNETYEFIYFQF